MLATGGTIVIPEKVRYKDPSYWLMLVEKWNITVWNSVPAFMEMFVDYLERFYKGEKLSINKILLSGDWIPVKLPEKICRFLKDVRIYSLGGATEASISVTFDEILRQILNNPTGEAITTFVKSKQNILTSENVRTDDFRIIEKTAKDTVYIFFHTALGTTNCYRFVEKELRKEDLGDFLFINVEDVEWYYSIQYHELVDRITDEYVRKIEQLHYKNINLIGYCLGGILALNVAVKLLEKGIEVNNLFVIDSYPVSGKVEDQFIDEVIFLPNYQLMLSEVLEDVDDFKVMEFITEVRKRNNGNIPQNTFFNIIEKDTKMKNNSGLWEFVNSTKEKRFEAYAKAIEKKTCINVSAELLEATFEIYQHGFKGANVELPFYSGDICYLSACEEQKYFFADKNQNLEMWNDICLGEFEVINVPGNHVTCIHSEENATLLAQIIIERNIRG